MLVYDYVPGSMWDRLRPSPVQLHQLAEVWLHLAEATTAGLWPAQGQELSWSGIESLLRGRVQAYADWVLAANPQRAVTGRLCLHALERIMSAIHPLADLPVTRGLGHWDPRFANVIQGPDGHLTLVDWEASGVLDPASDIACMLTHPNQEDLLTPAEWSAFLEPYLATRSHVDPRLSQRLDLWRGGFSIFWLGLLLQEGIRRASAGRLAHWNVNAVPANTRLRRYLARALTWPDTDLSPSLARLADITFFEP